MTVVLDTLRAFAVAVLAEGCGFPGDLARLRPDPPPVLRAAEAR